MEEDLFYQKNGWLNFSNHEDKNLICKDLHKSWDKYKQAYTEHTDIEQKHLQVLKNNI